MRRRQVEPIANPNSDVHVEGWVNSGYTKLHIWDMTEYDKVVYIDADVLVLENVDELFDRPSPAAAGRLLRMPMLSASAAAAAARNAHAVSIGSSSSGSSSTRIGRRAR